MSQEKVYTKDEIQKIAKSLIGKSFGEINNFSKKSALYDKGSFGHVIEEDAYDYDINSKSAPDFEEAGIELKVTPYRKNKDGTLSAKERLVLSIINYMEEYKNSFYESHFWYKNKMLQILWYLYEDNKPKSDLKITNELLFSFSNDDLPIIIEDWQKIITKIKKGKAHEISEADTMYLGACTKGANAESVRPQPFSSILAKQRAFCLKQSYMTQLVRSNISKEKHEKIELKIITGSSFESTLETKLKAYHGKTVSELSSIFGISSTAKNLNDILLTRMLGVKGRISKTDEFLKANIVPKTIRINKEGKIIESMSFPAFKFEDIVKEDWEDSQLYKLFSSTKFMFAVFREKGDEYYFDKVKFWNMSLELLDSEIKKVWDKTVVVVKDGDIVNKIVKGKRITNFPGMSESNYCHVRPHARVASDAYKLPVPDKLTGVESFTKQCFWLNNSYILRIINLS